MIELLKSKFVQRFSAFLVVLFFLVPSLFYLIALKFSLRLSVPLNIFHISPFLFVALVLLGTILYRKGPRLAARPFEETTLFSSAAGFGFLLLFYFKFFIKLYSASQIPYMVAYTWLIHLFSAFLLFFAFFGVAYFVKVFRKLKKEILVLSSACGAFVLSSVLLQLSSAPLAKFMATSSYLLLKTFSVNVQMSFEGILPFLTLGNFRVSVGAPCSGIDAIALFLFLFLALISLNLDNVDKSHIVLPFVGGLCGILILGAVRIAVLLAIGAYISRNFAMEAFHQNAGWVFFVVYFFVFIWITYPRMFRLRK